MDDTNLALSPKPTRPGISSEMLARCQIRAIDPKEAQVIFGHPYEGLLLPYLDLDGNPILDGGTPYFRARLAKPIGDMKYFQKRGTKPHAYLPVGLKDFPKDAGLFYYYAGLSSFYLGEYQLAYETLELAGLASPHNADTFRYMGKCLQIIGKQDAANEFMEKAARIARAEGNYREKHLESTVKFF